MTVYDEFLKVPDILTAEIIDGELLVSPHLDARHNRAANVLFGRISWIADETDKQWWIDFRPELHLGVDILVPETSGFRRDRVQYPVGYWETAPDWIAEVLSPATEHLDRVRKLRRYAAHGVRNAWLVNPTLQTLECYRLVDGYWQLFTTHTADDVVRAEPFEAIELRLSALWT